MLITTVIGDITRNKYYQDGVLIILESKNSKGQLHGKQIEWFNTTGKIANSVFYNNGLVDGEIISWWENGKLSCKRYAKNGRLHGKYTDWEDSGIVSSRVTYVNGLMEGEYYMHVYDDKGIPHGKTYYCIKGKFRIECNDWKFKCKLSFLAFKRIFRIRRYGKFGINNFVHADLSNMIRAYLIGY